MAHIQAFLVITLLTWAAVTVSRTTPELSTTTGDTVNIPCVFGEGTLRYILWSYNIGNERQNILMFTEGEFTIEADYANRASLQDDHSTLILKEITVADEGAYHCVVYTLKQTAASSINTKLNVFSLRPDALPVIAPCTGADESLSCSIHANQSFTLSCTLPNVYPVEDTELIWYQDGKHFSSIHEVTQNDDGTTDISRQIQVSETGNFTCNATFFSANGRKNTAVSVQAWIISPADVPNTPGKRMTSGLIPRITVLLVVFILAAIITVFFFRSKAPAHWPFPNNTNSDAENDQGESTKLIERPTENRFKHEEVKTSPTEEPDFDVMEVAKTIRDDQVHKLGKVFDFDDVEIGLYVATNSRYKHEGTCAMILDGYKKQIKEIKALLAATLFRLISEEGSDSSKPTERPTENRSKNEEESSKRNERAAENRSENEEVRTRPTEEPDFDTLLIALAKKISDDNLNEFGKKLGFAAVEIEKYVATNSPCQNVTCNGILTMLRDWDKNQTTATERAALKKALIAAGLVRLPDDFVHEEGSAESSKPTEGKAENHPTNKEVDHSTLPPSPTLTQGKNVNRSDGRKLSDEEIVKLSKLIPCDNYSKFCVALHFGMNLSNNIKLNHQFNYSAAFEEILIYWSRKTGGFTDSLDDALIEANLGGLRSHYKM